MLNCQRVFCRIFIVIKIMKNLWLSGVPTLLKLLRLLITNRNECDTHLKASTTSLFSTNDTPWSTFVGPDLHWWWSKPCRCFMWFVVQSCFFVSSFKCIRDGFGIRQLFEPHDARHIGLEHFHPGPHEGQFKSWWLSGAFVPFKKGGLTMFNLVQLSNRSFTWFNHV